MHSRIPADPRAATSAALPLAQWLRQRAGFSPQRPALTCGARHWTYRQLQQDVECMAAVLAAGGVVPGARVGYLGLNDAHMLLVLFAAAHLGAIWVPLNSRLSGPELAWVINDADIHTLVAGEEHIAVLDSVRAQLRCARYLHRSGGAPGWSSLDALLHAAAAGGVAVAAHATRGEDIAAILYTSGTTGQPKGALLTHGNFWVNNLNEILLHGMNFRDVTLNFAPMFHVSGLLCGSLSTLMVGGHLILQRSFDAAAVLQAIARDRVTLTFGVPAMLLFISQHPDFATADLSSLRLVTVGGAPMPEPLLRVYMQRGIPICQGYGLTETAAMATSLHADRAHEKIGSCGSAPLLTEVCLIDLNDGSRIEQSGATGEICVRGGNVTPGYWGRPDATAASFTPDGWFRTGDVGYFDDEGFFYVCDRLKDMIITGGENVYPAEVESVLYDHPDVAEIAVIGAPDAQWGERVVAVAAPRPGGTLTLEALRAFAEKRLARYKLPRELRLLDALPRNPTGKVLKGVLRQHND